MTYRLNNLLVDAIRMLGVDAFDVRIATGGSTTTMIDTTLEDRYSDDELKDATIVVIATSDNLAPMGEFSRISEYSESSMMATFGALTAAIESGDKCIIISSEFPLAVLRELANDALRDCGEITLVDSVGTTTDSSITEYTLSTEYKNLIGVYVQNSTTTGDNQWSKITGYRILPSASGADTTIIFDDVFTDGYYLQFVYNAFHPRVSDYDDPISESIPRPLAVLKLANKICLWRGITNENMNTAQEIKSNLDDAERKFPVRRDHLETQFLTWSKN